MSCWTLTVFFPLTILHCASFVEGHAFDGHAIGICFGLHRFMRLLLTPRVASLQHRLAGALISNKLLLIFPLVRNKQ